MEFQEPKVEMIEVEQNILVTSSCVSDASASPSMQSCSSGAAHEDSCASEADDWVD